MKTTATLGLLAAIALTGCATTAPAAPPAPAVEPATLVQAVQQGWDGDDVPDETWITTAATLVCKQIIGGVEPRVVPGHAGNNELVVGAAERFVCDVDR